MSFFSEFKSEIKILLVVLAVAVIIAVGGLLLLKGVVGNQVPHISNEQTGEQATELEENDALGSSSIDIFDWQTYRNKEYGFELKYPPFLKQEETMDLPYDQLLDCDLEVLPEYVLFCPHHIGIMVRDEPYSLAGIKNYYDALPVLPDGTSGVREYDISGKVFSIGKLHVYASIVWLVHTALDDRTLELTFSGSYVTDPLNNVLSKEEQQSISQILSTFRFIGTAELDTSIRNFDFEAYFAALPHNDDCIFYGSPDVHVRNIEYYDFTGNGSEEAVVSAQSCLAGTGGDDIFGIFSISGEGVNELSINKEGFTYDGLAGKMVFRVRDGTLVQIFPVYLGHEPNCCPEGGTREFIYDWNGKEFTITKVKDNPQE